MPTTASTCPDVRTAPSGASPLLIVMNAASGHQDGAERRAAVAQVLEDGGRPHRIDLVTTPDRLGEAARRAVADAKASGGSVVAAGGDGTLNTVAREALLAGVPFGALPQGTFNYFGRAWGLPTDPAEGAQALLVARPRPIRVGTVGDRIFLVNASLGLYPELLQDREAWKQRFGRHRVVALVAAVATLLRGSTLLRLTLEVGGEQRPVRTVTLFVGNNPLQLEQLGLPVDEAIGDGRLAAIVVPPLGPGGLIGLAMRGAFGTLGEFGTLLRADVERLTVRPSRWPPRRRLQVATDGEVTMMSLPLTFAVARQPLWLLLPPRADDGAGR